MTAGTDFLRVLHCDGDVVAVDKPGGMVVHPSREARDAADVLGRLRDMLGRLVYPVHRLDRAASGVLLFGLSSAAAAGLQDALAAADARKEYLALVRWPGSFPRLPERWRCARPLTDDRGIRRRAHSEFALLERFHGCALARVRITTGRRHQIRRHANHTGRHVLGDTTHGKGRMNRLFRERYGLRRLFLHLAEVDLPHPAGAGRLTLRAELPPDLAEVLARLRAEEVPA